MTQLHTCAQALTPSVCCSVGRAMTKPIYAQKRSQSGKLSLSLRAALMWWRQILSLEICELKSWTEEGSGLKHLLVDAASTPPCCAAVLFTDSELLYTVWKPSSELLARLKVRRDNQIMSLVWPPPPFCPILMQRACRLRFASGNHGDPFGNVDVQVAVAAAEGNLFLRQRGR